MPGLLRIGLPCCGGMLTVQSNMVAIDAMGAVTDSTQARTALLNWLQEKQHANQA